MKTTDFSNGFKVQEYFDEILPATKDLKITAVFSLCPSFSNHDGVRRYMEDSEIYILFENKSCLVISYLSIDALDVELRLLSNDEEIWYEGAIIKDYFNDSTFIYETTIDNHAVVDRIETIALEYDSIVCISLEYVTEPYYKWTGHSLIDEVAPKETTFETIKFTMSNGKSFSICPADAEIDGYTYIWSDDAKETITML